MKPIKFKVIKRNRYGHKWIEEPEERVAFRERCKHHDKFGCKKHYHCEVQFDKRRGIIAWLLGCTPDVSCPRLKRWDTMHGIIQPFTMVENGSIGL